MRVSDEPARQQIVGIVRAGAREANTPLSESLSAHMADAILRLINGGLNTDMPTCRLSGIKGPGAAALLADECLITCGLFHERTLRIGGPDPYIRVGRTAYGIAGLIEAAMGMHIMIDVLKHIPVPPARKSDFTLAREGSQAARLRLKSEGILIL